MERFTGMGFIRLCSSVHNIEITLLQVQNTEKQTKMIRLCSFSLSPGILWSFPSPCNLQFFLCNS